MIQWRKEESMEKFKFSVRRIAWMAKILGSPTLAFYYLGIFAFIFLPFIWDEMSVYQGFAA